MSTGFQLTSSEWDLLKAFAGFKCPTGRELLVETRFHPGWLESMLEELKNLGLITALTVLGNSPDEDKTYYSLTEIGKNLV